MDFLNLTEDIQQYVAVRRDFDVRDLKPYIRRANRKYLVPFVGDLYTELNDSDVLQGVKKEAYCLFEEALCNFAFYIGASTLILQISGAGIHTNEEGQHKKSTHFERLDWKRDLIRTGHESLDALLTLIEANKDEFTSYTAAIQTQNNKLLVSNTDTFNNYYHIHNSRQTFLALIPTMQQVEDQYLKNWLCKEYLDVVKTETPSIENAIEVKELLQKAVVAFTVSKIVTQGQFILDGNGIHLRFDRLPHESTVTNINLKINDLLVETAKNQENAGFEYLKQAQNIIINNPSDFTQCDGNVLIINEEDNSGGQEVITSTNKRILSI